MTTPHLERARLALEGLSVGDAFGQRFFGDPEVVPELIARRALPPAPWSTTDDTEMALAVYEVLAQQGFMNTDGLASRFAERYLADPARGYGGTAHGILQRIAAGEPQEPEPEPAGQQRRLASAPGGPPWNLLRRPQLLTQRCL